MSSAIHHEVLPQLDELVTGGLVILDDVDVIRYVANAERTSRSDA